MESPNNREEKTPGRYLLSRNEASSSGNGIYYIQYNWIGHERGSNGDAQITHAIVRDIRWSPQTDSKALLLKTASTQLTGEKLSWCLPSVFVYTD